MRREEEEAFPCLMVRRGRRKKRERKRDKDTEKERSIDLSVCLSFYPPLFYSNLSV